MKKFFSVGVCFMLVFVMLAGCGPSAVSNPASSQATVDNKATVAPSTVAPKPVTISLGIWPEDNQEADLKMYQAWVAKCTELYPYITIKPDHYKYAPETFIPKAESGQLPTIFESWYTEPQKLISNGYVADITDIMTKNGWDKSMNPQILKMMSKDGKIYGMPRDAYALGLLINMNLYKTAGLVDDKGLPKYPKTFDELAVNAKIIKDKTGKAGMVILTKDNCGGWHFSNIAWAFGAQLEKQVDGKWVSNVNCPEAVAALQYVKDLKWKYDVLLPNALLGWGDWIKNIGTDQAAMCFAGNDAVQNPVNDYKLSKDALALAPMPAGPKGQYSLMGGTPYMFANNATPEQIDAAFKFLGIMGRTPIATPEILDGREKDMIARAALNQPVIPAIQVWNNKDYTDAIDALYTKHVNVNMDLFKPFYDLALTNFHEEEPYSTQDLYAILDKCIQKVITDKKADPQALLDQANKDFQGKFMSKVN
jgi:multiple sugar transport system substrate-binding protein